jgi:hypothetical protein
LLWLAVLSLNLVTILYHADPLNVSLQWYIYGAKAKHLDGVERAVEVHFSIAKNEKGSDCSPP